MFKSTISALTSSVFKTAANTIGQYAPSAHNFAEGAYSQLINQGISNIAYRSPIMADIATTAFNVFQTELAKKKKISEYVKSSDADWLRPKVKEKLGDVSQSKIDAEMMKIIGKISSQIDKIGINEVKKNEEFKEYSQYFDSFKQKTDKPTDTPTDNTNTAPQTSLGDEILTRIEANTKQTVNALETLSIKQGSTNQSSTSINHQSFVDPITGMPSIKAGVGAIGGVVLSKLFDDKMIDKLVTKTRKIFGIDDASEEAKKPKARKKSTKFGEAQSVEKMFPKDLFDIKKTIYKEPTVDNKELNKTLKSLNPDAHKIKPIVSKVSDPRKIEEAIKTITPKIFKSVPLGKNISNISSSVANKTDISKLAASLLKHSPLHTTVPHKHPIVESAAGAVASGVSNVATAGLLSRFALPALAAAASAISLPVVAGIAGVGVLGYGGYKYLQASNKQNQLVTDATNKINLDRLNVTSDKQSKSKNIETLENKKAALTKTAKASEKPPAPVILNNTQPVINQPNNVIVSTNVRNKESTFERVQMQDFWSRMS